MNGDLVHMGSEQPQAARQQLKLNQVGDTNLTAQDFWKIPYLEINMKSAILLALKQTVFESA